MLAISLVSGFYALAIEMKRLLLAVAFQTRYAHVIRFPGIITLPISGWRRWLLEFFAGASSLA